MVAAVIFTVAKYDHGPPEPIELLVLGPLVTAGEVDSVVKSCTATWAKLKDGALELVAVIGEISDKFGGGVKADQKRFVAVLDGSADEVASSLLLEAEPVADAITGVNEDSKTEGQIALRIELENLLGFLVFDDFKIIAGQIGNKVTPLIGDDEHHVHSCHIGLKRRLLGVRSLAFCGEANERNGSRDSQAH
jgi:hypothetical protein